MRRLLVGMAAVLVLAVGGVPVQAAAVGRVPAPTATTAGADTRICTVDDERLTEISGLVATDSGYVVINDGSDLDSGRRIFFLDRACAVTRAVRYPSRPRDTEDLARAPDGTLWVADIGDNGRSRETVGLWKLSPGGSAPVLHRLSYPDGAHDAEALLLADDGSPVIVTKDPNTPGLYAPTEAPRPGRTVPMRKVGEFTLPRTATSNPFHALGRRVVTGAALAPDGSRVVLRSYADAFEFDVIDGDVTAALLGGIPRITPLPDEPQGEAIAYTPDGAALLTVSESAGQAPGAKPVILRYNPVPGQRTETSAAPAHGDGDESAGRSRQSRPGVDNSGLVGAAAVLGLALIAATALGVRRARRRG